MIQWAKFASRAKSIGSKAKAKGASFYKKNKTATITAGAGAGLAGSYQVGSKRAERKTTTRAGIAIGSAYVLGKQSKIKGNYEINVAPKFRAVAVQPSKSGNRLRQHSSDKKFLKSLKDKKFQAVLAKRKK